MSVTSNDIRWGSYDKYEGPWYPGTIKYVLPQNATIEEQILAVVTATEGGALDAINRYDACIDTQGAIQWCNRDPMHFVDQMYAQICDDVLKPVQESLAAHGYRFDRVQKRFVSIHESFTVVTRADQAAMYFCGSTGLRGSWTDEQKESAKELVAAVANMWSSPAAQRVQLRFTADRIMTFFTTSREVQILRDARTDGSPLALAFHAAYLSYAANNPARASSALAAALAEMGNKSLTFSLPWLLCVLKHLVFDAGVSIYPGRYNKIRPVIEKLYGVDLPDMAEDIASFTKAFPDQFLDAGDVQRALIRLGYDLGPRGADGVFGKKSTDALRDFKTSKGLKADGVLDWEALSQLEKAMRDLGVDGVISA